VISINPIEGPVVGSVPLVILRNLLGRAEKNPHHHRGLGTMTQTLQAVINA
jgi:hypothetical protein